jgi:DASS family divalent anion:Na+ symporter
MANNEQILEQPAVLGGVTWRVVQVLRSHGPIGFALLLGWVTWNLPPVEPMGERGMHFLATMIVAVSLWVLEVVDEYIVGLLLLLSWVVLDIVPSKVALAGFATNSWFFTIGALGMAAAVANTSLLRRIAFKLMSWMPIRCQRTYTLVLLGGGVFSGPLLPTGKARAAVAVPVSQAITEAAGFGPRSNGSAAISLAAFLGFSQMSFMFLTGGEQCLIAWNFLPPSVKAEFGWLNWFLVALPAAICIIIFLFVSIRFLLPLPPEEKVRLAATSDPSLVFNMGPISSSEWIILATLLSTVAGWATVPLHGVNEAWVALGSLLVLLLFGVLDKDGFKNKLDWGLILFFGVLNSLSMVTQYLKVDESLKMLTEPFLSDFSGGALGFLGVVFGVVCFVRFFLRKTPTAAVFTVMFLPFSESIGVHPGVIIVAATMIGECFLFGYQDGPYQIAYSGGNGTAFSHVQARKILAARYAATLLAIAISVPYWKFLGLIR